MHSINALTIDVEDYYQVSGFERDIHREDWGSYPSRVYDNTLRILELLANREVKATFFVLGWVADQFPKLVHEIDKTGHEVASHSYWHRLVYELTPSQFRSDLQRSRDVLQDIVGKRVTAYRAPSFSITNRSLWAFEILAEEGFLIDSSVYPIRHDRYGIPDAPHEPYVHKTVSGPIWEFPASVFRIGNFNLPISGGGYFRLYPYAMTRLLLSQLNHHGQPFVFYIHPWEFDPNQARLAVGTRLMRFRHYLNLHSTPAKFERLLRGFSFGRLDEVLAAHARPDGASLRSATEFVPASARPTPATVGN